MDDLVSIIVPIYNTGALLTNCVNSIINQDYSNLEIILVDDGSTDEQTIELCDALARDNSNISSYHKANGGSASARNYGISKANGKYIGFVDSDDIIDLTMYSTLYNAIQKDDVKVSICGISTEENGNVLLDYSKLESGIYDNLELMRHFLLGMWHSACTCLYDKSLFDRARFPEGEINEDYLLNYYIFKNLERLSFVNKPLYHYLRRSDSNTGSPKTLRFLDWINHTKLVLDEMSHNSSLIQEAEYQFLNSNIVLANSSLLSFSRFNSNEALELYEIVTENLSLNRDMVKRNNYLKGRDRYLSLLMAYAPKLYKFGVLSMLHFCPEKFGHVRG